jgi:L-lactate dehydrogenase complex protein LldG
MSVAREEILGRVRAALRDAPAGEVEVPRDYNRGGGVVDPRELFVSRAGEYKADVRRVSREGLLGAISDACAAAGAGRLVIPADLPREWRPAGVELVADDGLSADELDRADGVITGCAAAIAETGTLVLDGGVAQGRRAITLLPDFHLCVVEGDRVVSSVPEGLEAVAEGVRRERRPITLISGPSATSDIELQRVEGVHGPRRLVVLVVD